MKNWSCDRSKYVLILYIYILKFSHSKQQIFFPEYIMHLCFWFLPSHRYHARRFPSATAPCPQLWRHIGDLNLACVATLGGAASRRTSGRAVVPAGLPAVGFECPFFRHKPHSTSYIDCWLFGSNTCSELEMETWKSVQALNLDKSKLYTYIVRSILVSRAKL